MLYKEHKPRWDSQVALGRLGEAHLVPAYLTLVLEAVLEQGVFSFLSCSSLQPSLTAAS